VLPVRVVLNRVYRHWTAGLDSEQREKLDAELYAPPEGWEAADADLLQRIYEAADEGAEVS
jgi:hypothetical protein